MPLSAIEVNPAFIYLGEARIRAAISGLAVFGIQVYEHSYKIKHFEKFKEVSLKVAHGSASAEEMEPFLMEHLVDQVRTIICFENILKSIVLNNKCLIHVIDKNIFPDLHAKQRKEPVFAGDIINSENRYEKDDKFFFRGLLRQTITIKSLLYESKYLELINYPPDVLQILREINDERNQLHMLLHTVISFGSEYEKHSLLYAHLKNIESQLKDFTINNDTKFTIAKIKDVS